MYDMTNRCLMSQVMKKEDNGTKNITCLKSLTCTYNSCCYKLRLASTGINHLSSSPTQRQKKKGNTGKNGKKECLQNFSSGSDWNLIHCKCISTVLRAADSVEGLTLIMDFKPLRVACCCSVLAHTLTRVVKITPTQKSQKRK